jgi:hypothetical protein
MVPSEWPHLGILRIGGNSGTAGSFQYIGQQLSSDTADASVYANGPWELHWIFRLNQTTNTVMQVGMKTAGNYQFSYDYGAGIRFDTNAGVGDTAFMFYAYGAAVTTGVAADTNWHHLKIYWVSSNKIAMTLDGGAPKTACPSGCDITAALNNNDVAAADCGSDTVGSLTTVDLDYFGFVATVGSR